MVGSFLQYTNWRMSFMFPRLFCGTFIMVPVVDGLSETVPSLK